MDAIIRTVLDTFPKNESQLMTDEKRVLKTVLMMQAISQKQDGIDIFLPTNQNIDYAFEGTDLEHNRAVNIAKKLVRDGILYEKPMGAGKFQYAAAAVSGDQAAIDAHIKDFTKETKTMFLINRGELGNALSLNAALRLRFDVQAATADNFTATINKITNQPASHKIYAVMTFAANDEEQNKIRKLVKDAVIDALYANIVFIDASSTVLGGDRFKQWVECAANEKYWRPKDGKLADEMSRKALDVLLDWKNDISCGTFTVYSAYHKTGEPCGSEVETCAALANIVLRRYPFSFDNAKVSDNFFLQTQLPSGAKFGISQTIMKSQRVCKNILTNLPRNNHAKKVTTTAWGNNFASVHIKSHEQNIEQVIDFDWKICYDWRVRV